MSQTKKARARFAVSDTVRVRSGVTDPDFPDIPLGGWAGKITEVEEDDPPLYLIRWSQDTLKNVHPVYRKRCENTLQKAWPKPWPATGHFRRFPETS